MRWSTTAPVTDRAPVRDGVSVASGDVALLPNQCVVKWGATVNHDVRSNQYFL